MKKTRKWFSMACMALLTAFVLTSCSDDQEIGSMLEGSWEGQMGVYVEDDNGATYSSVRTRMSFGTDPFRFTRGDGYWVDYYNYDFPWGQTYIASHIRWRVENKVIKIHFIEDKYDIEIRDYDISHGRFIGEIHTAEDYVDEVGDLKTTYTDVSFSMYKLDVEPIWGDFYYYDRGMYFYAPAKNGSVAQPKRQVFKRHFRPVSEE